MGKHSGDSARSRTGWCRVLLFLVRAGAGLWDYNGSAGVGVGDSEDARGEEVSVDLQATARLLCAPRQATAPRWSSVSPAVKWAVAHGFVAW